MSGLQTLSGSRWSGPFLPGTPGSALTLPFPTLSLPSQLSSTLPLLSTETTSVYGFVFLDLGDTEPLALNPHAGTPWITPQVSHISIPTATSGELPSPSRVTEAEAEVQSYSDPWQGTQPRKRDRI